MSLQRGDEVCFRWNGRWKEGGKLIGVYDYKNARKVEHMGLEYIVEESDISTADRIANERALKALAEARLDYGDIIEAWNKGLRTNADIAKATNTPIMGICSRIRAAKRRGLLK